MIPTWLKPIEAWRSAIVAHLVQQDNYSPTQSNQVAQHLVLGLLWLLCGEQRRVLPTGTLEAWQQQPELYMRLVELLQQTDDRLGITFPFPLPFISVPDALLRRLLRGLGGLEACGRLQASLLGQVYEQSLTWQTADSAVVVTKKNRGAYYTPAIVVNHMVEKTIGPVLAATGGQSPLHILDPACGGGAFLLGAYHYLLDWQLQQCLTQEKFSSLLQNQEGQWHLPIAERVRLLSHLYGVDIDPQAIAVSKLSLWLMLLESPEFVGQPLPRLPDFSSQLRCGNALIDADCHDFAWKPAFPEILANGGFEVVIGNPPYLDSEGMTMHLSHWRQACTQRYRSAVGNWDLFCVFIEKAIELCRFNGFVSLVVPNKLASADYARPVRQLLTQQTHLISIRDYAAVPVFAASVYPLVFVAQKGGRSNSPLCYEAMQDLQQLRYRRSIHLPAQSGQVWRFTTQLTQAILSRLQQTLPTLGEIACVQGAATVAEAYEIQSLIQGNSLLSAGDLHVINSGTIDRYRLLWGQKPLRYLGQLYQYPCIAAAHRDKLPVRRYQQAIQPKIIVAGLSQRLECAIDRSGSVLAGKSTSVIWQDKGDVDLRYLLGLLNSQLLSIYFCHSFGGNRLQGGYYRVGPPQLRSLPIYLPDLNDATDRQQYDRLIGLVEQRLSWQDRPDAKNQPLTLAQLEHAIDQVVYAIYCLTDVEIDELVGITEWHRM